eukprot:CAMPEP_0117044030 /NCGR_PEP_ID=MMETSP0472-20121206/30552_1 /TAXON_ID=693140 ORGANISM="Tiarina fusus, Strain LIS" /NCGR_SAMPLE_ID=MMETSP0472 /ASSEMBLY_ACC=CAM_ASM_000603 /LENGTH=655 /DNA_ID=CAMNT_0004755675 /DNA_START=85 /DNA_END=2050 /DNA_ORIENTATION=+
MWFLFDVTGAKRKSVLPLSPHEEAEGGDANETVTDPATDTKNDAVHASDPTSKKSEANKSQTSPAPSPTKKEDKRRGSLRSLDSASEHSTSTSKSRRKLGKKKGSKRNLLDADDCDEKRPKEVLVDSKAATAEIGGHKSPPTEVGQDKKETEDSPKKSKEKVEKKSNEDEDSPKKSKEKAEKKTKRSSVSADDCNQNESKEVGDGVERSKESTRRSSSRAPKDDRKSSRPRSKSGLRSSSHSRRRSKSTGIHSSRSRRDRDRSDCHDGGAESGKKVDSKSSSDRRKRRERRSKSQPRCDADEEKKSDVLGSGDTKTDKKSRSDEKKRERERKLSNRELLDWLSDDSPDYSTDGGGSVCSRQSHSRMIDEAQKTVVLQTKGKGQTSGENAMAMSMLLDRIKSLEADNTKLRDEQEDSLLEQERLELLLQQELDENSKLRAQLLELQLEAKGDRFTSIASDTARGELVAENESLKRQLQKELDKQKCFEMMNAADEIKKAQEEKDELQEIIDSQKLMIQMLTEKAVKEAEEKADSVETSPQSNGGKSEKAQPPTSFGGFLGLVKSDTQGVEEPVGDSFGAGLTSGLRRIGSAGDLLSSGSAHGGASDKQPAPSYFGGFLGLVKSETQDFEEPVGSTFTAGLTSGLRKVGSAGDLFSW